MLGTALEPLELTAKRKMLQKLLTKFDNTAYLQHNLLQKQQSLSAGGSSNSVVTSITIVNLFSLLKYLCSMIPPLAGGGNLLSLVEAGTQV